MLIRCFIALTFVFGPAFATESITRKSGKFEVTLRLPEGGLFPQEEQQLEFRVADSTNVDPVLGAAPVIRARIRGTIDMPSMPGMAKFQDIAHPEGVAGDYGLHPTFAHGGEYRLRMEVEPPDEKPFTVEFPLNVDDAAPKRKNLAKPFRLEMSASPKNPKAGEPVMLTLRYRREPTPGVPRPDQKPNEVITKFERVHEELMHLIVVRRDLGEFSHQHPQLDDSGTFRVTFTFPTAGEYHLFADAAPVGAGSQILMAKLKVSGKAGEPFQLARARGAEPAASALKVKLDSTSRLPTRKTISVQAAVTDESGRAVTDLQPYLGAMGHFILIHEDGETFVHSHPDEREPGAGRNGVIPFLVRLPKPGLYRGWIQVQRNSEITTTPYVLEAAPAGGAQ